MANRTVKDAHSVKGTNPQYLVEKIIRTRIYESKFWKEQCFALSAELMVDKAMELRYVGGVYGGNIKPSPFLCLVLKMLQIQPDKDIIVEFISQQDFKYVRALGAVYMRLTGNSLDCYKYLEPLYLDYRKLRRMNKNGEFELVHMDEFIDELIREERVCDIILPRIQKRMALEEGGQLPAKDNYLEDDMEDVESSEEEEEDEPEVKDKASRQRSQTPERESGREWDKPRRSPSPRYRRSRSRSPHTSRSTRQKPEESGSTRHRRDRERRRSRSRERRGGMEKSREKRHREEDKSHSKKHSSSSKSHKQDTEERRHHHKSKKSKKDRDDKRSLTKEELEIQEQNELRAKLGMAPLR